MMSSTLRPRGKQGVYRHGSGLGERKASGRTNNYKVAVLGELYSYWYLMDCPVHIWLRTVAYMYTYIHTYEYAYNPYTHCIYDFACNYMYIHTLCIALLVTQDCTHGKV